MTTKRIVVGLVAFAAMAGASLTVLGSLNGSERRSFTLFIHESPEQFALRTDKTSRGEEYWKGWNEYHQSMVKAGVFKGGMCLPAADDSKRVEVVDGKRSVKSGPVHSSKPAITGYMIIEVESLDSALEWASKGPNAATGGVMEVRAEYPHPMKPASN